MGVSVSVWTGRTFEYQFGCRELTSEMYKKADLLPKGSSQNLRKLTKTNQNEDNDKDRKKIKERESPLSKLLMNSPKGQTRMDPSLFTKHSASRNHLLRQTKPDKADKKKPGRPSSGLKMDHSSTSKHRPASTKEKAQVSNQPRKKAANQSSSTDMKKKKKEVGAEDEDTTEYKRLQEKLNYLEGKIMAIKNNLDKKTHTQLKKSETEKIIGIVPKADFKKERRDLSKKENQDTNALSKFVTQVRSNHSHNVIKRDPYLNTKGVYYVSEIARSFMEDGLPLAKDHIIQCLQTMKFMKQVSKPSLKDIEHKKIFLQRKFQHKSKKTVILDLDETLIHCNQSLSIPHDIQLQINFPTGQQIDAGINIRPYATELLRILSEKMEVIIFTASHPCYANVVIDYLDPGEKMVSHRLYRDNCWQTEEGVFVKDLRILGNRELSDVVLVDNAAYSYFFQLDNGIPIIPYYQGKNDFELKHLVEYIEELQKAPDVREVNRRHFKLDNYLAFNDPQKLTKDLYAEYANGSTAQYKS